MSFVSAMENIFEKATQNNETEQDGYIGENGLRYCSICHTPNQCRTIHPFTKKEKIVTCLCKCGIERNERKMLQIKSNALEFEYDHKCSIGFTDFELFRWFNGANYKISPRLIDERQKLLKRLCFPAAERMQNCTFENEDGANEQLSKIAREYVENFDEMREKGIGLLLFGKVGLGKTHIAACIANALIDKGVPAQMTSFERLFNILMGMFKGKQEYIDSLNKFDLLVIDDLAAEKDTEAMGGLVHNIIDSRIKAGLPMIITTNLDRQEMLGTDNLRKQRIYSRLFECCIPHEVKGNDRRMNKLQENRKAYNDVLGLGIK
jgi:DNA replication protein DnaC